MGAAGPLILPDQRWSVVRPADVCTLSMSKWEWKAVGLPVLKPAKKMALDGSSTEQEYIQLACPLGCGCVVEVMAKNRSKHQSVLGRAHLRKCPKLSEEQRLVFAKKAASKSDNTAKRKKKRQALPAPPDWEKGMSAEDYIKSFAFNSKKRR